MSTATHKNPRKLSNFELSDEAIAALDTICAQRLWSKTQLRAELPAFAAFLLKWKPPKSAKLDPRSRVVNFWHPDIARALLEKQPECKALEVIDLLDLAPWQGTATEFYNLVRATDKGGHWERLFSTVDKCGRILTELSKICPARVTKTTPHGISQYAVTRKP
jgi:hypothetical protein